MILYRRAFRYLALPAALYLAIGLSWGAYKYRYTGEFSTTTNTVGENAWIGLWQVPNRFRWHTADASYFEWAEKVGLPPTSKRASDAAVREVVRFGATYPVYVMHLALHRFRGFVNGDVFNGVLSYPHVVYQALPGPAVFTLMAVVLLCLTLPHEARRTLFLGWPVLFNLPLFLLFFSDGMRHIAPCTASLLVSAVPPLLETGFYRQLGRRRLLTLGIAATFVASWYLRTVGRSRAPRLRPLALLDAVSRPRALCLVPALTIEYLSPVSEISFPVEFFDIGEDGHFWMQWRLAVALRLVEASGLLLDRPLRALDIGGGAGRFRDQIERATQWRVDMTDLHLPALQMARPARGRTLYYDVTQPDPSLVGSYDAAFLFDVIEHVPSPGPLLRAALEHLRPGGHLFLNVPALQALYSAYDVVQGHVRRYSPRTLAAELDGLPCELGSVSYWGFSLVPLLGLTAAARRTHTRPDNLPGRLPAEPGRQPGPEGPDEGRAGDAQRVRRSGPR